MSIRELVVLGTASQTPTKTRNHNGYLLRWDGEGLLFDPGEGTQRQMTYAGVAATDITRLCLTHFHGDHCLGVPGVVQRLSLERVSHPVYAHYPASGREYFSRLRYASAFHESAQLVEEPVMATGLIGEGDFGALWAHRLDHRVDSFGYRLVEPDGRRMLPQRLAEYAIAGPAIRALQRAGSIVVNERQVTLEQVSEARPGQRFAFIMDTRLCDGVYALADSADLLVIESTFLHEDADLAQQYSHLTVTQAARVAAECRVRRLVLTHFSQRYEDLAPFFDQARAHFDGDIVIATDLSRIDVPRRANSAGSGT